MPVILSYKKPKDNWFWLAAGILLLSCSVYLSYKYFNAKAANPVALLLPLVYASVSIALLKVYLLRRQYQQYESGRVVLVDKNGKQLKIIQSGVEKVIEASDVMDVEVHDSWNSLPLFSALTYVRLNLIHGDSIVITRFTASETDLHPVTAGKPTIKKTRLMNSIE